MSIDLTKCAYDVKEPLEIASDDTCKKYLLGTFNQEEAIQLVKKYVHVVFDQNTKE